MISISEWWMWVGFFIFIAIMLAIDMLMLGGRKAHKVSIREALAWTIVWVALACMFNLLLWWYLGRTLDSTIANEKALQFFTGYLIEKSLSVDNIFVFIVIFSYFSIPAEYQRRILLYGVLGAIIMRFVLILLGIWLVMKAHWILYIFGIFLVITGVKMIVFAEHKADLAQNSLLLWMRRHLRITDTLRGERFFIWKQRLLYATPLFMVLLFIEISDLIFAVDSIPAIFAITQDSFIVFTSNIFAILGLRSLYFLIADMAERFYLLKYGLAVILVFIGCKMLLAYWYDIPTGIALGVVIVILLSCMLFSRTKRFLL